VTSSERPARQHSRARIREVLREAGCPVGIAHLTAETGLSAGAVRFHLANLLRDGSARSVHPQTHPGRGRPVVEYEAAPTNPADPAEAYRMLAAALGRELRRSRRPRAAFDAGRHWAQAASFPPITQSPETSALDAVTQLFHEGGFAPAAGESPHTVELHECPFYELATELPGVVCAVHHGLTEGALERAGIAATVRVVPVLDGSGPCLVHLHDASREPVTSDSSLSTKEILP
jgi:predicted ArsR family transcriptional regulator